MQLRAFDWNAVPLRRHGLDICNDDLRFGFPFHRIIGHTQSCGRLKPSSMASGFLGFRPRRTTDHVNDPGRLASGEIRGAGRFASAAGYWCDHVRLVIPNT